MTHEPRYADFFVKGSLWKLLRGANAYTFVETYELLRRTFGYQLHYANYGLWTDGLDTDEPGRQLSRYLGEALGLKPGDKLLEAGSGLGQCAVDLCTEYDLAAVRGLNICVEQANYANALARHHGLQDKIEHQIIDACKAVQDLEKGAYQHALAQECIGHFPDPGAYLRGLSKMLPSGGRMAFTLVTSPKPPPRSIAAVQKLVFNVVPHSGAHWEQLFKDSGFVNVRREIITDQVFVPLFGYLRRRFKEDPENLSFTGPVSRLTMRALLDRSEEGVRTGTMGYELLVGEVA